MKRPEWERDSCLFERWHHEVVGASPWGDVAEIFSLLGVSLSSWKALRWQRVNAGLDNTQSKLGSSSTHKWSSANTHTTQTHIQNTAGYTSVCYRCSALAEGRCRVMHISMCNSTADGYINAPSCWDRAHGPARGPRTIPLPHRLA